MALGATDDPTTRHQEADPHDNTDALLGECGLLTRRRGRSAPMGSFGGRTSLVRVIVGTNVVARRALRPHRARWIGGAAVVTTALATAAAASGILVGRPPIPSVDHLSAVDKGCPADLRAHPDVENAMALPAPPPACSTQLTRRVGYCLQIATEGDRPRGACASHASEAWRHGDRFHRADPVRRQAPLLVADDQRRSSRAHRCALSERHHPDVALGRAGYWLLEVQDDAVPQR